MDTSDVMGDFLNQSPKADHRDASADVSIRQTVTPPTKTPAQAEFATPAKTTDKEDHVENDRSKTTAKLEGNVHLLSFNYNATSEFPAEATTSPSKIQFGHLDHSEAQAANSKIQFGHTRRLKVLTTTLSRSVQELGPAETVVEQSNLTAKRERESERECMCGSDYASRPNGARATEATELMTSAPKMAPKTITEMDFAAEVTAAEDDDEDSILQTNSKTGIDKTESATAGLTERVPTEQVIAEGGPTTDIIKEESREVVVDHFKWLVPCELLVAGNTSETGVPAQTGRAE
jgi:hypothetical protein